MKTDAIPLFNLRLDWRKLVPAMVVFLVLGFYGGMSFAQDIGSIDSVTADPLGSGLCWLVSKITGKFVFALSVIGLFATVVTFLAGVEMNELMKKLAGGVFVVSLLLVVTKLTEALSRHLGMTSFC